MPDETILRVVWRHGYHASDYIANHPNEGRAEFPPSPRRLYRALLCVQHTTAKEVPREHIVEAFETLSKATLTYHVPKFTIAQTGSYVPFWKTPYRYTTQLLDKFYVFDGPLEFHWDVKLPEHLLRSLTILLDRMFYFGRSESLLRSASFVSEGLPVNMVPWDGVQEGDLYPVVFPAFMPPKLTEKLLKSQGDIREQYGLLETMEIQPQTLNRMRMDHPVQMQTYVHIRKGSPYVRIRSRTVSHPYDAAILQVRPKLHLQDFIPFAHRVHDTLTRISEGHPTLTGACRGAVRKDGSQHAKILPLPNKDGLVTHILVTAPTGFNHTLQGYLQQLDKHLWFNGEPELQFSLFGNCKDFQNILTGKSDTWVSLTPFHPTMYPKRKLDEHGIVIGSPEYDLRRLIRFAGLPDPVAVIPFSQTENIPWYQYQVLRSEQDQGRRGPDSRTGYRIRFPEPVEGPLSFGFNSHYGLGLFRREA